MTTLSQPMRPDIPGAGEPQGPVPFTVTMKAPAAPEPAPEPRTAVSDADSLLKNIDKRLREHLDSIDTNHLTPDGVRAAIETFSTTAAAQVDRAEQAVAARLEQAEKAVDDIISGLSRDEDVAGELRRDRAWNSAVRQLDSAPDNAVAELAQKLIAGSDDVQLSVLVSQLPQYLASRGQGAEWLPAALDARVPGLAEARDTVKRATQAQQITRFHADAVRERLGAATPAAYWPINWVDVTAKYDPDRP
jgi:hypothetical protein